LKLTGNTTCPGCKKDHKVEFDLEKLDVKPNPTEISNAQASGGGGTATVQQVMPKEVIKEVTKTVIEDFKPNYECPDGNCEAGVHKNKNYKKPVKGKCNNCDQFTRHGEGTCPWCKKNDTIEEIDKEELEELGIDTPTNTDNEEHDHE